jgi:predicted RNA-binding protein (virulence factor B family)
MIEIGMFNDLTVKSTASIGLYLTDGHDDVLLPVKYVPANTSDGDSLNVFVYLDNENRPIATTLIPHATVGEFAFMKVKEVNEHGAFLDWGISKDLFVPYSEQRVEMQEGENYLVHIFIDDRSGRIAASSKWKQFINTDLSDLNNGDEVKLLIAEKSDLGFKAIIDNSYEGLIYHNEVFEELKIGEKKRGFIKLLREDGKVDVSLQQQGYEHIIDSKHLILHYLKENNGILKLGDKSSPEEINQKLKLSKKAFKKIIGGLYKDQLISIGDYEIKLLEKKK